MIVFITKNKMCYDGIIKYIHMFNYCYYTYVESHHWVRHYLFLGFHFTHSLLPKLSLSLSPNSSSPPSNKRPLFFTFSLNPNTFKFNTKSSLSLSHKKMAKRFPYIFFNFPLHQIQPSSWCSFYLPFPNTFNCLPTSLLHLKPTNLYNFYIDFDI